MKRNAENYYESIGRKNGKKVRKMIDDAEKKDKSANAVSVR